MGSLLTIVSEASRFDFLHHHVPQALPFPAKDSFYLRFKLFDQFQRNDVMSDIIFGQVDHSPIMGPGGKSFSLIAEMPQENNLVIGRQSQASFSHFAQEDVLQAVVINHSEIDGPRAVENDGH